MTSYLASIYDEMSHNVVYLFSIHDEMTDIVVYIFNPKFGQLPSGMTILPLVLNQSNISNCLLTIAYRMTFDLVSCSAAVQNCLKISFFVLKHRALKTLLRYERIGELQYKDYLLTLFQSKFMKFKARVLRVIVRQQYRITIRNLRY